MAMRMRMVSAALILVVLAAVVAPAAAPRRWLWSKARIRNIHIGGLDGLPKQAELD
ncbi:MAG TPA: hypothetical protein VGK74_18130 [Symbiobacteriaceae bacterium]|jgi:hypothetical protein